MKSFLKTLIAVLIAHLIALCVIVGIVAVKLSDDVKVEDGSILILTLDGPIPDSSPPGGLPLPGTGGTTHTSIMENLEKARHDDRIKGVVLKLGSPGAGFAKMGEWRERIRALRDSGKPVWAHTNWLGRGGLYLGGICDSLFMLPSGYVSLRGFASGRYYFKGTLEKLGVSENLHRIEHYKAMAEMVQRDRMSETSRANTEWMLDTYYPHYLETVEGERELPPGTLEGQVFSEGTLVPQEALELGLVDRLLYWDEVESMLLAVDGVKERKRKGDAPPRPRTISGCDYAQVDRSDAGIKAKKKIAVVHAMGLIAGEESSTNPLIGRTLGARTMSEAFRAAAEDEDIAAILYRVDTGGGESAASWRIQRAALQAAEIKPMVVSVGDVAASGGYTICYPCESLVASRLSVVGSIGSISGKFNLRGLLNKLGITMDFVTRGPNALMESDYYDYTADQWASFKERHWRDYHEWVDDIAHARGRTPAEIDSVGRGRVWTGEQALEHGLIDRIGSFDEAVRLLKEKAEIPAEEEVEYVHYPREKGLLEALRTDGIGAAVQALVHQMLAPVAREGTWAIDWNDYH